MKTIFYNHFLKCYRLFYRSYLNKKKTLLVHAYTWKVSSEWYKLTLKNYIYILVIMTSPFYSRTLLYSTPPSSSLLPIQVVNAISIFGNDKTVYLQSKGCMPTANRPLQSFSYFYLVIVFTAGQYGWSRTYVLGNKYKRRQAIQYVYEWKHLYHSWPF